MENDRLSIQNNKPKQKQSDLARKPGLSKGHQNSITTSENLIDSQRSTPEDVLDLQKTYGNKAVTGLIQDKLAIGPASDAWEQQAEQISGNIDRSDDSDQLDKHKREKRNFNSMPGQTSLKGNLVAGEKFQKHLEDSRGDGIAMPSELRQEMEQKLGTDLGAVRLHTNNEAHQLNRSISASAFTLGEDIYFKDGKYSSTSPESKKLLAHELTHVVQQSGKTPRVGSTGEVSKDGTGNQTTPNAFPSAGPAGVVQRYYDDPSDLMDNQEEVKYENPELVPDAGSEEKAEEPAGRSEPKSTRKFPRSQMAIDLTNESKREHPEPLKLPEKYKDEEKKVGWRAFFDQQEGESEEKTKKRQEQSEKTTLTTRHFTDEERRRNEFGKTGDKAKNLYAMSPQGRMVTQGNEQSQIRDSEGKKQNLHHSSIFSGGDVAHAGHIGSEEGKVNYLDDDSGHYRPEAKHTWDAYSRMKSEGKLTDKGKVMMVDKSQEKGKGAYGANNLELPFSSYEQTHGNEEQARNKKAMMSELLGATSDKRDQLDNDPANPGQYGTASEQMDNTGGTGQGGDASHGNNYLTYQEATRTQSSQSKYLFYENKSEEKQEPNYLSLQQAYQNSKDNQVHYENESDEKGGGDTVYENESDQEQGSNYFSEQKSYKTISGDNDLFYE